MLTVSSFLFDGYTFRQVSGPFYVAAGAGGDVIGEELEGDSFEGGEEWFQAGWGIDGVVD
jgi:hypothetical protein